jgi:hypothetical protein
MNNPLKVKAKAGSNPRSVRQQNPSPPPRSKRAEYDRQQRGKVEMVDLTANGVDSPQVKNPGVGGTSQHS